MLPSYAIYVINLDRSQDRLQRITQTIKDAGLSFCRVSAVDGTTIDPADYKADSAYYQGLSANEIACYLSPVKCWERIVEDQVDFGIIFEDDAHLNENFKQVIEKALVEAAYRNYGFLKFSSNKLKKKKKTILAALSKEHALVKLTPVPVFTNGQAVSKAAAQELIETCSTPQLPIDVLFRHEWLYDFQVINVFPDIVRTAPGMKTAIGKRKSPTHPIRQINKQLWKLKFHLKLYYHLYCRKSSRHFLSSSVTAAKQ